MITSFQSRRLIIDDGVNWSLFLFIASFYQEYDTCLADVIEKIPYPVPKVFLFYGSEAYQTSYVLKKGNVCPGIKYNDLKKIVLDSGKQYFFGINSKLFEWSNTRVLSTDSKDRTTLYNKINCTT